jgi:hypothetical protein
MLYPLGMCADRTMELPPHRSISPARQIFNKTQPTGGLRRVNASSDSVARAASKSKGPMSLESGRIDCIGHQSGST